MGRGTRVTEQVEHIFEANLRRRTPLAIRDLLDANYRQLGRYRSYTQIRYLPRSAVVTWRRTGCCTVVLHACDLDALSVNGWPLRPEANARCDVPRVLLRLTCHATVDVLRRPLV